MTGKEINRLIIDKLSGGQLSPQDDAWFERWYADDSNRAYYNSLLSIRSAGAAHAGRSRVDLDSTRAEVLSRRRRSSLRRISRYAAAVAVLLLAGAAFLLIRDGATPDMLVDTIVPGKTMAFVTLSTGDTVEVGENYGIITDGELTVQSGVDNGLNYSDAEAALPVSHTVTVPKGGEFKITLSDGSEVWINSDTRITYPVAFHGDTREVYIEGEAYFKVYPDTAKPFVVHAGDYNIRVTGTEFNVKNYLSANATTTLVEGAVVVERGDEAVELRPGQQAIARPEGLAVRKVDVGFTQWRDGMFNFSESRLDDLLDDLARWYDFEIVYIDPEVRAYHFSAKFNRQTHIDNVINVLSRTQKISLELEDGVLTVSATR